MKVRAAVVGIGARTPLGLDARSTGFAHRTGAAAMTQSALLDKDGEPVTMCLLPTLDPFCVGAERAVQLGEPALIEATKGLEQVLSYGRVKLFSCLDAWMGEPCEDGSRPAADVAAALQRRAARLCPKLDDVDTVARGPASMGYALEGAFAALERGGFESAIIGGVHTDYHPRRIATLSHAGRLASSDNLDGFIPGECAAFVVLMKPESARTHRLQVHAEIHSVATAFEKARPDNDESAFKAHGLTTAVRGATAERVKHKVTTGWMLTDLTYELMRHYEFTSMSTRTQKLWCEPQMCDSPGQRIGYLGAAAMPLHVVLGAEAWRRGWAPHPEAISLAGSDAGERAVIAFSEPGRSYITPDMEAT